MLASNVHAQHNVSLEFTLEGKKFDSLRIATLDTLNREAFFYGKTTDHHTWKFEIPSAIWSRLNEVVLGNSNAKRRIYEYVQFLYKSSDNSIPSLPKNWDFPRIVPDWSDIKMRATYLKTDTVMVQNGRTTLIYYDFATVPVKSSGMEAWIKCPYFSAFTDDSAKGSSKTYEQYLTEYRQLAKEYPDSRLLIITLLNNLNRYRTVGDAQSVYNCFSEKDKTSYFGKEVEQSLMQDWTKFDNLTLQNVLNNKKESIVQDSTKYTLICLTASWCTYCKQEIPLLKQVYNDLKNDPFEMVSVSVDDKSTVPTFREEVINDSIPWRCLSAYPVDILKEYAIQGIPVNILVFPDKHIMIMDIREADNKKKLYEYVHNRENYLN
jgi:thiol-disulfide isomerase/thioredoxin